jgi:hypothetical protein
LTIESGKYDQNRGLATGSRECAPDDKHRVTHHFRTKKGWVTLR